jgi:hypothetical protein
MNYSAEDDSLYIPSTMNERDFVVLPRIASRTVKKLKMPKERGFVHC